MIPKVIKKEEANLEKVIEEIKKLPSNFFGKLTFVFHCGKIVKVVKEDIKVFK